MKCRIIEAAEAADKAREHVFAFACVLALALLITLSGAARAEPFLYHEMANGGGMFLTGRQGECLQGKAGWVSDIYGKPVLQLCWVQISKTMFRVFYADGDVRTYTNQGMKLLDTEKEESI